ncbi:uncharacterized protein DUF3108 [Fluviicoccus keumensis]|uniref:Uncharacterized protein DUF3108 n=1 Tax=Fluviicoccus keumensis TaxID=1435465 RepID=A0A4Q7ZBC1_9GAMM|nr:DUF3108 domain-containing protein [Fluviicoccus keumensis]RZU47119.1 uncharacterized protein DUF3108 [Fluviicoccus keumensis]
MTAAWFRRHTLGTALLLSLLAHLAMLWDGELASLTDMLRPEDPDRVLDRKKAHVVPKVRLSVMPSARPAGTPGRPQVTLTFEEPPKPAAAPKKASDISHPEPKTARAKPAAAVAAITTDTALAVAPPPPAGDALPEAAPTVAPVSQPAVPVATAPPAPKYEPPPSFPAELRARYRASVEGIKVDVEHVWRMEGYEYSIENVSTFIGMKFRMNSVGGITPDSGLQPSEYRVMMNKKLLRFANFDYSAGVIHYGKPDREKAEIMTTTIYDPWSLSYQLAVAFTGEPVDLFFTTGTRVSRARLELVGEERLKLPGGELKTLHIRGQSLEGSPFEVDVWLAPEHRNFPAKIHIARGKESLDLSLKSLAFEGQMRFGKNIKGEEDSETAIPKEWLENPDFKDYRPAEPSGLPGEDAP